MRPPEVTDVDVVNAGKRIQAAGQRVSGYQLRKTIGRGAPERLMAIWDVHTAGEIDPGATSLCHDLPDDVEHSIVMLINVQAESARKMARSLMTAVNGMAAGQLRDRDAMIQSLSVEHANEIAALTADKVSVDEKLLQQSANVNHLTALLAESASRLEGLERERALGLERETQQRAAFEELNSRYQSLLQSRTDNSTSAAQLDSAHIKIKELEADLAQLTLTNNAVCDQSNERKLLLATAEEKIKGLVSRNADLIRSIDAQRVDLNRTHQMNKTLEMHGARMQSRIDMLEGRGAPHGAVSNG